MIALRLDRLKCQLEERSSKVKLVAVSKKKTTLDIITLHALGVSDFAESYLQEARKKIRELSHLGIEWHFIGRVQSNKVNDIALEFDWVQSISSKKILNQLDQACQSLGKQMNACIQIKLDRLSNKAGVLVDDLEDFMKSMGACSSVLFRGLMFMPDEGLSEKQLTSCFKKVGELFFQYRNKYGCDTLSMGMSSDYLSALEQGSNLIRIGTALLGERVRGGRIE